MPAPKSEPVKTFQKMTPVATKPAPKKTAAPQPKKVEVKPVKSKPVETFKSETESTAKSGIDAALDGLE
jgi:hypothetical protein